MAWSITGPFLRGSGVNYDVRKAQPYWAYDRMEFEVPLGKNGDNFDRFLVRMAEMEQSMRIAEQGLEGLPSGSIQVDWEGKARIVGNEHPTQKPLELFARPIRKHTKPGDLCFEPFSGSGSQIIAAAKEGRRCYAIEIEPAFVDVARRRWTKFARSAGVDPGPGALEDE